MCLGEKPGRRRGRVSAKRKRRPMGHARQRQRQRQKLLEIRPGFVALTDKAQVVLSKDLATEETRDKYSVGEERK